MDKKLNVTLYTTYCSACDVLKLYLDEKNITYDVIDDMEQIYEVADINNILSVPILKVPNTINNDNEYMFLDFDKAIDWVKEINTANNENK